MMIWLTSAVTQIYDLNNVPLVSGVSLIKWHLPHSMHGEHRGRTARCPIANHRVEYNYTKVVLVRVAIDRNSNLTECPIEFEVLQEFNAANDAGPGQGGSTGGGKEQKVTLGTVRLNLSEYVEESEGILQAGGRTLGDGRLTSSPRPVSGSAASGTRPSIMRSRTLVHGNGSGAGLLPPEQAVGPRSSPRTATGLDDSPATTATNTNPRTGAVGEEGVVRRYLMQESKVNSTLKIGILMVQMDGDRNFVAPPLRTAPVFGGIAGLMAGEPLEPGGPPSTGPDSAGARLLGTLGGGGPTAAAGAAEDTSAPNSLKSRDPSEMHDMYRRALAASWACNADELPADECIEDIFAGGDGFGERAANSGHRGHRHAYSATSARSGTSSLLAARPATASDDEDGSGPSGGGATPRPLKEQTLRPTHQQHRHHGSHSSSASASLPQQQQKQQQQHHHHSRTQSAASERSTATMLRGSGTRGVSPRRRVRSGSSGRAGVGVGLGVGAGADDGGLRSRSGSFESLVTINMASSDGFKRAKEVDEAEVREDLVAWATPRDADA